MDNDKLQQIINNQSEIKDFLKNINKSLVTQQIDKTGKINIKQPSQVKIEIEHLSGDKHLQYLIESKKIVDSNFILFSDGHHYNGNQNTSQLLELDVLIKYKLKPIIVYHDFKIPNVPTLQYDKFDVGDNDIELMKPKLDECYGINEYDLQYSTQSEINTGYVIIIPK